MQTIELIYPHSYDSEDLPETVAAIGFFDGIHKGHQKVIKTAVDYAQANDLTSAVITFYPHPSVVLRDDVREVKYITPPAEKQNILQKMGIDKLYIIRFNKELSLLPPQVFIDHFIAGLNVKHLVAGFDFSYGHKGKGNMCTIDDHSKGRFATTTVPKVEFDGEKVSSTKIRQLLKNGDIHKVNQLLGRCLTISGRVVEGNKRGHTLGYPTANLDVDPEALLPKPGIYAVKVVYQHQVYEAMASLGFNPTFENNRNKPVLEVNILDFSDNLYGEKLRLEWHAFIREEQQFSDVQALIQEMANDEKKVRHYFAHHSEQM